MNIKNGIAYSGNVEETGTIEDKIISAMQYGVSYIQIRAKDIQDYILNDGKIENNKIVKLQKLVQSFSGEISVHLPKPVWNIDNHTLSDKNQQVITLIKNLLLKIGIQKYTIHPHYNKMQFEQMENKDREMIIQQMAYYFAQIAYTGATVAIENVPVRDSEEIYNMPDGEKKRKNLENISYGSTIEEIDYILTKTRKIYSDNSANDDAHNLIGITYDTGHSVSRINNVELRRKEIERWINHFKDDIKIFHITPSIHSIKDLNGYVKDEADLAKTSQVIEDVYGSSRGIDALYLIEAHASLNALGSLYLLSEDIKKNFVSQNVL